MEKFSSIEEAQDVYPENRFLVLTDEEADEKTRDEIIDSLWAFRPSFLSSLTDLPEEVFEALSLKCEDANEPILRLVKKTCGVDALVEEAISADGRGHFLAHYDHEESEIMIDGVLHFVYRQN